MLHNEKGKALSACSVDYIHVTLQKALSQAVRDNLIPVTSPPERSPAVVASEASRRHRDYTRSSASTW
jgi:hypothetical protein